MAIGHRFHSISLYFTFYFTLFGCLQLGQLVEIRSARARAGRAKQLAAATQRSELESLARFHSTPSMASSSLA